MNKLTVSQLKDKLTQEGIKISSINGTGKNGAVIKTDLIKALTDRKKGPKVERVSEPFKFKGKGKALVKYGIQKGDKIRGDKVVAPVNVRSTKSGYEIEPVDQSREKFRFYHTEDGIYRAKNSSLRVRFYKVKGAKLVVLPNEKRPIHKEVPKSEHKVQEVPPKLFPTLHNLLADFAIKIDKDFNLMSCCDVDAKKYAEDYIRRDLLGKGIDIDELTKEFDDFLKEEVASKVK